MSNDTIKRSDAIKAAEDGMCTFYDCDVLDRLNAAPSADRQQGEWINKHEGDNGFLERECSLCGAMKPILMHTAKINFCPNCGAKMSKEMNDVV